MRRRGRAGGGRAHFPPSKLAASQAVTVPNEPINLVGPPETVLYALFFQQANGITKKAAALEKEGGNPAIVAALEDFYVEQAGLTPAENNEVFQAAADYAGAIAPVDAEATNLLTAFRRAKLAYSISQGPKPTDPTLMAARAQLQTLLGADGFYMLELYVHRTFGRARPATFSHPATAAQGGGE